jgi:hypothetical protein
VVWVKRLGDTDAVAEFARGRAHQDAIVTAQHHRCVIVDEAESGQLCRRLRFDFRIGEEVRLAVSVQEPFQPQ